MSDEMYFVTRIEEEEEMPAFGGRRDKHDEHDSTAGQPKEIQRNKAQQERNRRRASKNETLRGNATNKDGKGKR